jgi:hypothetical protein
MNGEQGALFGVPEEPVERTKKEKVPVDLPPAGMALLRGRATSCSSCGAAIVFAITVRMVKGEERLRAMPVDLEPAPGGNVRLTMSGRNLRAYVIPAAQARGRQSLHHSHMQTCPEREAWRRKGSPS